MDKKIYIYEVEPEFASYFDEFNADNSLVWSVDALDVGNVTEYTDAEVISTFIGSRLDATVLEKLINLKLIATRSTGFDHIDLNYCRDRHITVCNVPNYGSDTVAEHAFAMLLAITHKLEAALYATRHGVFSTQGLRGMDLFGKTLGVIGTGNIGSSMVRIAHGFGMNIVACDLIENHELVLKYGVQYMDFNEALENSDVISIHVPGGNETRHMFGDAEFSRLQKGAILINTSRGDVVDTFSLIRALTDGRLAAAGLDVLPAERELRGCFGDAVEIEHLLHANHTLMNMPNVIVTPHNAFNTFEAVRRIIMLTINNIKAYIAGQPVNVVS